MTILVEATHSVKPLTNTVFDKWVEWYGNEIIPAMERNGFDVIGAFKRSTGPMGEDMLLTRFESTTDYEKAGLSLRADQKFLAAVGARNEWTISERVKTANFVPYATEQRLERMLSDRPAKPRQYMQATLQMKLGGQLAAYEAVGKLADIIDASGRMRLVTAYETAIGQRGELTDIWAYMEGMPDLSYRPGDPLAEVIGALRKVAPEESIAYLNPLPYSKLQ